MANRLERRGYFVYSVLFSLAVASVAGVPQYEFTIKSDVSGLNAAVSFGASTSGTLIGNYDAKSNPTGTRTKPGLFGSFGDTENLPVDVSLGAAVTGSPNTQTSGGFSLAADLDAGLMNLSNYAVNLLSSGSESLTAEITLSTQSFRTRNPTFLYLGGIPITIPIGQATLTSLTATQIGDFAPGTLTQIGDNRYSFLVAPLLAISGSVEVLGTAIDLPATPLPFPLSGEIEFSGTTAHLLSVQPIEIENSLDPNVMLPQFPLPLPTLNPDEPANVLFDLLLSQVGANLSGELRTEANGVLVPEPASLALLLLAGVALRRR